MNSQSSTRQFKIAAGVIGILVIVLVSFAAGVNVGSHKATFASRWGENYERHFLGEEGGIGGRLPDGKKLKMMEKGMRNAHGVAGEVLSVSGATIILKDRKNQESTVRVNESTIINRGPEAIALAGIALGDRIAVIGKPQEDGVVAAHLIRVLSPGKSKP